MPQTLRQWEDSLRQPALCELLPVGDYLDGLHHSHKRVLRSGL